MIEKNGYKILDESSTVIDSDVKIGKDTVIYPNNVIKNGAIIGENCEILQGNYIVSGEIKNNCKIFNSKIANCKIDENCVIDFSVLQDSNLQKKCKVGPFANIRTNSNFAQNVKAGAFTETKNVIIGENCKLPHLIYCGDAELGANCNLGCGTVFANYDGKRKQRCSVGDNCFIGCNCNLIAPLNIGSNCFIAAGTTVTKEVEDNKFVIGRVRQEVKENNNLQI